MKCLSIEGCYKKRNEKKIFYFYEEKKNEKIETRQVDSFAVKKYERQRKASNDGYV